MDRKIKRAELVRIVVMPLLIAVVALVLRGAEGDPAILDLKIVEGDGAVYVVGSRATRGVTVQVSDESGRPVSGATVSFALPQDGPGGAFVSGGRAEIVSTRADGRATVWGMQWNRTPGPFEIRITAAKGQARAGILCPSYLNDSRPSDSRSRATRVSDARPSPTGGRARAGDDAETASETGTEPSTTRRATKESVAPQERAATTAGRSYIRERAFRVGGHRWVWIALGAAGVAVAGVAAVGRAGGSSAASPAAVASTVQIGTPSVSLGRP